jgi:hypothetical protein
VTAMPCTDCRELPICHGCKAPGYHPNQGTGALAGAATELVGATCAVCLRQYPMAQVELYTEAEFDAHMRDNWKPMAAAQVAAALRPRGLQPTPETPDEGIRRLQGGQEALLPRQDG